MDKLEKLQSALAALSAERAQIINVGWYLQHCWLVQVKPGGNARTDRKYWQVRSRQAMFAGKTLKHLKPDEVEEYQAAIARGRQLKQIERQIEKLQQQLAQLTAIANSSRGSAHRLSKAARPTALQVSTLAQVEPRSPEPSENTTKFTDLTEQERLVKELLANSRALRNALQRSTARNQELRAGMTNPTRYPR